MIDSILNFLFPEVCALCGTVVEEFRMDCLCSRCWDSLWKERRAVSGHGYQSVGWYGGVLERAIRLLKYSNRPGLAHGLAELLVAEWFSIRRPGQWVVVAVPLHRSRLRERGYNQSQLLAKHFAKASGYQVAWRVLLRSRSTRSQAGLSDRQRQENVRGAFQVRRPQQINTRPVILIDDVITTGATVQVCKKALEAAGARPIEILSLAHAARWQSGPSSSPAVPDPVTMQQA